MGGYKYNAIMVDMYPTLYVYLYYPETKYRNLTTEYSTD